MEALSAAHHLTLLRLGVLAGVRGRARLPGRRRVLQVDFLRQVAGNLYDDADEDGGSSVSFESTVDVAGRLPTALRPSQVAKHMSVVLRVAGNGDLMTGINLAKSGRFIRIS